MALLLVVYFAGVLTIISPCILPVLPFVVARADRPFVRNGLPLLVGMTATFTAVATLAAVGGGWAVHANQYGRFVAMGLLAAFGLTLIFPGLAARAMNPVVALGGRLSRWADRDAVSGRAGMTAPLLLGAATGLLWAPCAGPVLGLILTGAALQGANARTTGLLMSYAAGSATSLALALLVGGRVFSALKRSLGAGEWIRQAAGVTVLLAVGAVALGLDTGVLARLSLTSTAPLEQQLLNTWHPGTASINAHESAADSVEDWAIEGTLPPLAGAVAWLNSPPLTLDDLRGRVVLVDFWTYSCINCLRTLPYVRAWAEKYAAHGLVVLGVHAPEFAFEKDQDNVRKAVADLGIRYPVAIDNDYAIWRAFKNEYWPAHYFIDSKGRIRHHHFGEGGYDESERIIQRLLAEIGAAAMPDGLVSINATGAEAAPSLSDVLSAETYIGYARAERFMSAGGAVRDHRHLYSTVAPALNEWGLAGAWTIGAEDATLDAPGGRIVYRFHARDLHLVLGASHGPVRFRVTMDGKPLGDARGADANAFGEGTVTGQRLYQLVRQRGTVTSHVFEITFLDAGVQAYAFTFG